MLRAALAVVLVLGLAACTGAPDDVPMPPADASPEEVVTAFIASVNAGDMDTVVALSSADLALEIEQSWEDVTIADVQIRKPTAGFFGGDIRAPGQENIYLPIDAVFHGTDGSLPDGELTGWGYTLARPDEDSPWVIWSQGVG